MAFILEAIHYISMGFSVGIYAVLEMLPFYEQLSGIKEQLVANALGVPVLVVSLASTLITILVITIKRIIKSK